MKSIISVFLVSIIFLTCTVFGQEAPEYESFVRATASRLLKNLEELHSLNGQTISVMGFRDANTGKGCRAFSINLANLINSEINNRKIILYKKGINFETVPRQDLEAIENEILISGGNTEELFTKLKKSSVLITGSWQDLGETVSLTIKAIQMINNNISELSSPYTSFNVNSLPYNLRLCLTKPSDKTVLGSCDTHKLRSDMVLIRDNGPFLYGENKERISIASFRIDRFEVTNAEYADFLNSIKHHYDKEGKKLYDIDSHFSLIFVDKDKYRVKPGMEKKPVTKVTWFGADAYCKCYGKRLPTEQEWEKAARSIDGRNYPWGNEFPTREHANFYYENFYIKPSDRIVLENVDSFERGKSPYGIYNMAGNVFEWTSSKDDKGRFILRGGDWSSQPEQIKTTYRYYLNPNETNYTIGFRCAE
jgi:hypothetical protein